MLFGVISNIRMRNLSFFGIVVIAALLVVSCKTTSKLELERQCTVLRVDYAETVRIALKFPRNDLDSVIYSVDGTVYERKQDTASVMLDTRKFAYGDRSLTARVYADGK